MASFEELPEECIAAVLCRTTPVDAGRFSLVSKTFRSIANSDAVWNHFLPSDSQFIDSIISQSPSIANVPTKKALYLALSDRPVIIDHGKKGELVAVRYNKRVVPREFKVGDLVLRRNMKDSEEGKLAPNWEG